MVARTCNPSYLVADGRILVGGRSGQPTVTQAEVPAGAYTLTAESLPGYSASTLPKKPRDEWHSAQCPAPSTRYSPR